MLSYFSHEKKKIVGLLGLRTTLPRPNKEKDTTFPNLYHICSSDSIVIKLGSDWPIRPVNQWISQVASSSCTKDQTYLRTDVNRPDSADF